MQPTRVTVTELPGGLHFGGTLGWLSWLALLRAYLVGFRNRAVVFVKRGWMYLRLDRANRVIVEEPD
ncbi:MAG TPA: hypothetical protein VFF40_03730 [Acidimicrobiia bacterium]|nr:hypothetical protein [Acidimicrobiia bacterium]